MGDANTNTSKTGMKRGTVSSMPKRSAKETNDLLLPCRFPGCKRLFMGHYYAQFCPEHRSKRK